MKPRSEVEPLYRFHRLIAAGTHESWLEFLPPVLIDRARASPLGLRLLSTLMIKRFHLGTSEHWNIAPANRWVLQERDALLDCALRIGTLALAPLVRRCVERKRVAMLKEAFAADLFAETFAGDLSVADLPLQHWSACSTAAEVRALAQRVGAGLMLDSLPSGDTALGQRAMLRFPKACVARLEPRPHARDQGALGRRLMQFAMET
jgi:YOP proteins translocation protein K (YscK)